MSHSQIERKVSVILSLLDFVGVLTKVDQTMHSNSGSGAIALSHSSPLPPSLLQVDQTMHDLLKDLSHLANTKHIRVTRKAKQIAGSYQNNIAEQNKMVVLPALRQLSSAALSEEKEAEIVSSLLVELTLAQAKVLAMLGSSDKALRKAVAKAAVLLWYAHFDSLPISYSHIPTEIPTLPQVRPLRPAPDRRQDLPPQGEGEARSHVVVPRRRR